ncbi:MAG: transcriptional regulator [Candidatus Nanohaloarchaea archaeon]
MKFESEVIANELLPAIRSIISSELKESYGLEQKQIARDLDISEAAVSQYITGKRADKEVKKALREDPQVMVLLNDAAGKLAKDKKCANEISEAVQTIRDKGLIRERFGDAYKL